MSDFENILSAKKQQQQRQQADSNMALKPTPGNYQVLVPDCLKAFQLDMKSTELRLSYDAPTDQTTYTYCLVWDGDEKMEQKYREALYKAMEKELNERKDSWRIGYPDEPEEKKNSKEEAEKKVKSENTTKKSSSSSSVDRTTVGSIDLQSTVLSFPSISTVSSTKSSLPSGLDFHTEEEKSVKKSQKTQESSKNGSKKEESTTSDDSTDSSILSLNMMTSSMSTSSGMLASSRLSLHSIFKDGMMGSYNKVTVKLIFIDSNDFGGTLRVCTKMTAVSCAPVLSTVLALIHRYSPVSQEDLRELVDVSGVYNAFLDASLGDRQRLRLIPRRDLYMLSINQLATINGDVILIVDPLGYLEKNKRVTIELDGEKKKKETKAKN